MFELPMKFILPNFGFVDFDNSLTLPNRIEAVRDQDGRVGYRLHNPLNNRLPGSRLFDLWRDPKWGYQARAAD